MRQDILVDMDNINHHTDAYDILYMILLKLTQFMLFLALQGLSAL